MVAFVIGETGRELKSGCVGAGVAAGMGPQERIGLSVRMLARAEPVTKLAERHGVSRKFLYAQAGKAEGALSKAFAPCAKEPGVLFYLPVTDEWIRQFVVAQVLLGHSSFRGVQELLRDLLDHDISLGTIGNILREIVEQARKGYCQMLWMAGKGEVVYPWCRKRHRSPDRAGGYTTWKSLRLRSWFVQECRGTC